MRTNLYLSVTVIVTLCCEILPNLAEQDIRHPPNIVTPSFTKTLYFRERTKFNISCKAEGIRTPRYTWQKDGSDIDSKFIQVDPVSGALWVDEATNREEGVYRCLANNTWGTAVSYNINMILIVGDTFEKTKSRRQSGGVGEGASLECRNPPTTVPKGIFTWYTTTIAASGNADAVSITPTDRIGVDERGSLHFAYLLKSDKILGKEYACAVQNYKTSVITLGSKVQLNVTGNGGAEKSKPRRLYTSGTVTALLGETATLECFFSGNPVPRIRWYDNSNDEIVSDSPRITIDNRKRRLLIDKVTENDEGQYKCEAANTLDTLRETLTLNVTSKPIWVEAPQSQKVVEGTDVTFTCKARAARGENPPSPPVWYQNWEQIYQNDSKIIGHGKFRLTNVSRDRDIMNVQCIVENEFGSIFQDAFLNVLLPVTITVRPATSISIEYGDMVNMSVSATTDPSETLTYHWKLDGKAIYLPRTGFTLSKDSRTLTINTTELTINELDDVFGLYTCNVTNSIQSVPVGITLKAVDPPVTEGVVIIVEAGTSWWILAVVLGILLLIGAAVLVACFLRQRYPKRVYLLEKKELKSKLDPVRDLENDYFQTL